MLAPHRNELLSQKSNGADRMRSGACQHVWGPCVLDVLGHLGHLNLDPFLDRLGFRVRVLVLFLCSPFQPRWLTLGDPGSPGGILGQGLLVLEGCARLKAFVGWSGLLQLELLAACYLHKLCLLV